jgi:hypothetical protein
MRVRVGTAQVRRALDRAELGVSPAFWTAFWL